MTTENTIVACATAVGLGAIAVIRISGYKAIPITDEIFESPKKSKLASQLSHTVHFGIIRDGDKIIDEVLATIFRAPRSYTAEDSVEISCHSSSYIVENIINLYITKGARLANPGEFTLRAFLNGKLDLAQAEGVADLIASNNAASHQAALQQMRKGYSHHLKELRQKLLDFASLIELELDFSEEDVEFAKKEDLRKLIIHIETVLKSLIKSFSSGNVMKYGIPVAIIGKPNVGKSTLLNALLNEERAIVSHIAGTTRDAIEDQIVIGGISFRFIDTAGIRHSSDFIENIGIKKTFEKLSEAKVIIYLFDATNGEGEIEEASALRKKYPKKHILAVANKVDVVKETFLEEPSEDEYPIYISAKNKFQIERIIQRLESFAKENYSNAPVVTNIRHLEALKKALESLSEVKQSLNSNLSGDLLAIHIKEVLHYIGIITGKVTNDSLLENIFSNFCIGK